MSWLDSKDPLFCVFFCADGRGKQQGWFPSSSEYMNLFPFYMGYPIYGLDTTIWLLL